MKNVFKVATLSAMVMLAGNVVADEATGQFQWNGKVPVANTGTVDFNIVSADNLAGTLVFEVDSLTKEVTLLSATPLSFHVEDSTFAPVEYYYQLSTFTFSTAGGSYLDASTDFAINVDGLPLSKTVGSAATTADTVLNLVAPTALTTVAPGDMVVVQAAVLISSEVI